MSGRQLSELEWLGLELALDRYFLKSRTSARMLTLLIRRAGITCRAECLLDGSNASPDGLKVYVSNLRSKLADLGFKLKIEAINGCGYRISESAAEEVMRRVGTTISWLDGGNLPSITRDSPLFAEAAA